MTIGPATTLILQWLGHASFLLTIGKHAILIDPFSADQVGYKPISVKADVVLISHHHFDHDYVRAAVGKPKVIDKPGIYKINGITVTGYKTSHGNGRGDNTVFIIEAEGIRIAHCGDLGVLPSESDVKSVGPVDVVMVPVGGYYTIDAAQAWKLVEMAKPKIVIPMHYRHPQSKIRELAPIDVFLKGKKAIRKVGKRAVIGKSFPKADKEIWILDPP